MKKIIIALSALLAVSAQATSVQASETTDGTPKEDQLLSWPVKGKAAGEDIIY
ncbi:MAG: hypothetical protein IAC87_04305, partial [Muribaculum sp.]|nr:hypothetical protein [Candidatus Merdivivens faecigallinarum]